jgi:hypothetical protein
MKKCAGKLCVTLQEAEDEILTVFRTRVARFKDAKAGSQGSSIQGHYMEEVASIARKPAEPEGSHIDG